MTLWKTRVAAALTIAMTVVACSLDELIPEGALGIDDGASSGAKESLKVDNDTEARIEIKETGATLTVPKGAVEHSVTIGVERPSDTKAVVFVESLKTAKAVASAPYVLTPHGTEFAKDLKLQIPVVSNKGKELVAAYLKDESDRQWKYLDTPVVEGDIATVTLKHFSVIVLLDRESSGLEDQIPDAGSSGSSDDEPGASEAEDAGNAGTGSSGRDDADAGAATRADAGSSGGTRDASPSAAVDAAEPTPAPADAGVGAAYDANYYPEAETPPPVDIDAEIAEAGAPDASDSYDAAVDHDAYTPAVDGGYDAPPTCEPVACSVEQCGTVADGCGGVMECGNCEYYGGVCNHDQHICEYIGQ